jgi:hypothetical protein
MAVSGAGGPSGPADSTNAGTPGPGGSLSGDLSKEYAIKRLKRQQSAGNQANLKGGQVTTPPPLPKLIRY